MNERCVLCVCVLLERVFGPFYTLVGTIERKEVNMMRIAMKMMPRRGGMQIKRIVRGEYRMYQMQKQCFNNHRYDNKIPFLFTVGSNKLGVDEMHDSKRLYSTTFSEKAGAVFDFFGSSNTVTDKEHVVSKEDKELRRIKKYKDFTVAFEDMKKNGVPISLITYKILLQRCSSMNRIADAELYFNEMKLNNIEPDIFTYNILINMYGKNDYFDTVVEYLNEMKSNNS